MGVLQLYLSNIQSLITQPELTDLLHGLEVRILFVFILVRSPCKILIPTTTPSGRISNEPEEERKKERRKRKNALYSGQLRFCLQPRAAHALRSDQLLS